MNLETCLLPSSQYHGMEPDHCPSLMQTKTHLPKCLRAKGVLDKQQDCKQNKIDQDKIIQLKTEIQFLVC